VGERSRTDRAFNTAIGVVLAIAIAVVFANDLFSTQVWLRLDFYVYRESIQSMLSGGGLYEFSLAVFDGQFPFTYPPFAALVLLPIAVVPVQLGQAIWMLFQLVLVLVLVRVVLVRTLPGRLPDGWKGSAVIVSAWLVMVSNSPITQSLLLGQVSLAVSALVIVDFLVVPARFRGVLTGLAGAVKLLPLVYVPYFLITRQWRVAATTVGAFAGATGLTFLILPHESVQFWTGMLFQTQRVGDVGSMRNKSVLGFLTQWGIGGDAKGVIWVALVVVLAAIGYWRAYLHYRRGEEYAAMLVVGLLAGAISPISWMHHLVWLSFGMLYLAQIGSRVWASVALVMAVVFFVASPLVESLADGPPWLMAGQNAVLAAMVVFIVFGFPLPRAIDKNQTDHVSLGK
jgi:alpha-1,2-mannosyltransferase